MITLKKLWQNIGFSTTKEITKIQNQNTRHKVLKKINFH